MMKKLILILLCLPLLFSTCKKEVNKPPAPINLCCCGGTLNGSYLNIEQLGYGVLYIPNAFTPNNDGVNDLFSISLFSVPQLSPIEELTIYNGQNSIIVGESWDGTFNNTDAEDGVYNYTYKILLPDTAHLFTDGQVSLVRNINNNTIFNNFPSGVDNCTFGDMIHPRDGFVYNTQENINNWGN